jgi:hemolysin activation/secretion protein
MNMTRCITRLALAASVSLLPSALYAQPVSVDPAQVERRFDRDNLPIADHLRRPELRTPDTAVAQPQARQRFDFVVKQVLLEGNQAIKGAALAPLYQPAIGKKITQAEATKLRQAILKLYRSEGYALAQVSFAPAAAKGQLVIKINEGRISRVNFTGAKPQNPIIDAYVAHLTSKSAVKNTDIERFLLLINDLPGTTAKGAVVPAGTAGGSHELVVSVNQKAYDASYSVDNRGSKFIGPVQHSFVGSAYSLFDRGDRTTARFITTSPIDELKFFDLLHEQPVGSQGGKVALTGSISETKPGSSLSASRIEAQSQFARISYTHPIVRERLESFEARAMVDARNTDIDTASVTTSKDRLRTIRAGGIYEFADGFNGSNLFNLQLSQGVEALGGSDNRDDVSRTGADASFTKLNFDLSRTHYLPVSGLTFFTAATAQYASDKLLGAEQISFGGNGFGRGYNPVEIAGDHGLGGKAELRYGRATNLEFMPSYQLYGYYDAGRVWTRGNNSTDDSLASTGIGLRTQIYDRVSANVEVAFPLTKDVSNEGNDGDSPRFFFGATTRF